MFCLKCGKEIENGAKFCPYCGAVTGAGAAAPAPAAPAPVAPVEGRPFDGSSPASGGNRRRGMGLIAGGLVAVVLVAVLAIAFFSGLFSSPKAQVEKALGKTMASYAASWSSLGLPNLMELSQGRSYSQSISFTLDSINQEMTGSDMSALKGIGIRMGMDYDQGNKKMDADMAVVWDGEDLGSVQMLVDGGMVYLTSPDFTKGDVYGFNTETIGADLDRLGADGGEVDLKKISFNIFDLIERAAPSKEQTEDTQKAIVEANKQLMDSLEVEKGGKKSVEVNGKSVDATVYNVTVTKDAMKAYINAMEDAMKAVDAKDAAEDILTAMGFDKGTVNDLLSELDDSDPYSELASQLKQAVKTIGDVELEVYVSGGCVSAVEYSDRIENSKVELGLYLGGGSSYVDDLSLELTIDGETLTVESSGNHAGKDGVFTDETTARLGSSRFTSELRYEPKADNSNFEWELKVDNTASVTMEGQLTTSKDSVDLRLDDLSVKAAGLKMFSLEGAYYLGPCKGMKVSVSSPTMLADMDEDDLMDLVQDIQENAADWGYDVLDKLPDELIYLFL